MSLDPQSVAGPGRVPVSFPRVPKGSPFWAFVSGLLPLFGIVAGFTLSNLGPWIAPSWWDLVACVASCCAVFWIAAIQESRPLRTPARQFALGFAIGVAGSVSLLCLPAVPLFLVALMLGVGLLAMAPYWNLLGALALMTRMRNPEGASERRVAWLWGVFLLGFSLYPASLTWRKLWNGRDHGALVASGLRESERVGWGREGLLWGSVGGPALRMPRELPSRLPEQAEERLLASVRDRTLLSACYYRDAVLPDAPSFLWGDSQSLFPPGLLAREGAPARAAWFRRTGIPFWTQPVPVGHPETSALTAPSPDFSMVFTGGERLDDLRVATDVPSASWSVRGPVRGLRLTRSQLRAELPARIAGDGFVRASWWFEVENGASFPRQTRMQFRLPPGGFVDDLHLWVFGRQQRAAFAGDARATAAYEAVARPVESRLATGRDPALLRQVGPDRYRLVVYPVPAGEAAQFRVSFVLPYRENAGVPELWLPTLADRDTALADALDCEVLLGAALDPEEPEIGRSIAPQRIGLDPESMRDPLAMRVPAPRQSAVPAESPAAETPRAATRRHDPWPMPGAEPLVLFDAYHGHAGLLDDQALSALLEGLERPPMFAVIQDGPTREVGIDELRAVLSEASFQAPYDRFAKVRELLARRTRSTDRPLDVLWIHAASTLEEPVGDAEREVGRAVAGTGSRILSLPASATLAPNVLVERWTWDGTVTPVFRGSADLASDITRLRQGEGWLHRLGERAVAPEEGELGKKLGARNRIEQLLQTDGVEAATRMAIEHRIVSPTVSAVVLETRQDYVEQGIAPPDHGPGVPGSAVPEPSTWLLMGTGLLVLFVAMRRRRA